MIRQLVVDGLVESSHDIGEGGIAVALAECSFGGVGCEVKLPTGLRPEFALFHEGPSRILVSTSDAEKIHDLGKKLGIEVVALGSTIVDRYVVTGLLDLPLGELRKTWESALETKLHA